MFEEHEDSMEAAFRLAVDMVNDDKSTLVRTQLTATPEIIPHGDSFKASQKGIYVYRFQIHTLEIRILRSMKYSTETLYLVYYL